MSKIQSLVTCLLWAWKHLCASTYDVESGTLQSLGYQNGCRETIAAQIAGWLQAQGIEETNIAKIRDSINWADLPKSASECEALLEEILDNHRPPPAPPQLLRVQEAYRTDGFQITPPHWDEIFLYDGTWDNAWKGLDPEEINDALDHGWRVVADKESVSLSDLSPGDWVQCEKPWPSLAQHVVSPAWGFKTTDGVFFVPPMDKVQPCDLVRRIIRAPGP